MGTSTHSALSFSDRVKAWWHERWWDRRDLMSRDEEVQAAKRELEAYQAALERMARRAALRVVPDDEDARRRAGAGS